MKTVFERSGNKPHKEINKTVLVFPVVCDIPFPVWEPDGSMPAKIIDTAVDLFGFGYQGAGNYQYK